LSAIALSTPVRRTATFLLQVLGIAAITVALLEGLAGWSLAHPRATVIPLDILRPLHVLFDRNVIQVMPECAVYDEGLTYRLRPGRCTFANREFSNEFFINSLGVRDDESSLDQPRVIMIGDSLTMGWGVDQEQAFASVFERQTGLRTLNAGVSSYGTVRELRMLERVDRRAATDIVIQYSDNDLVENEQLVSGRYQVLSREDYDRTVRGQAEMLRYHPGKHTINLAVLLRNLVRERGNPPAPRSAAHEAEVFLKVMERSPVDLSSYRITVLSLDPAFADAARDMARTSSSPVIQRLRFLDASSIASIPDSFYVLDNHPTGAGHEGIAKLLAAAIVNTP
jgi:hypothetical protein